MLDTIVHKAQVPCSCVLMELKQQIRTKVLADHAQLEKAALEVKSSLVAQENTVTQTRIILGEDCALMVLIWRELTLVFHQVILVENVLLENIAQVAELQQTNALLVSYAIRILHRQHLMGIQIPMELTPVQLANIVNRVPLRVLNVLLVYTHLNQEPDKKMNVNHVDQDITARKEMKPRFVLLERTAQLEQTNQSCVQFTHTIPLKVRTTQMIVYHAERVSTAQMRVLASFTTIKKSTSAQRDTSVPKVQKLSSLVQLVPTLIGQISGLEHQKPLIA